MILFILFLMFFILSAILYMMDKVQSQGEVKIITYREIPVDINVILVLGAGMNDEGKPCDMLLDRLLMTVKVSRKIANSKILISGYHGRCGCNEVGTMKKFIMKNYEEIDERNIFLDHAGFSTYDSIYRAKEVFKVDKVIIISNEYHLPRALYIASKMGIEAYGISSDCRLYEDSDVYKEREVLAQVKDYIYVNMLKPKPRYLGMVIPINISDGRITDNKI